ncbi:hypothetical protein LXL04_004710 [Taraxacum kok-saghyz]
MRLKPGSIDTRFAQTTAIGVPNRGVPNRHKIAPIRQDHRFLQSIPYATPIDPIDSRSRFETYRFNFDFGADSWNSDFGSVPFDTATLQLKSQKETKRETKRARKRKKKEKEEAVAEPRPKRNVKVSKMICSPYMERIAKIKDRVKADELVLCNSIFASKRDTKEKVWENDMGDMLYQSDVYTFKANFYINWRIINCWISIMNARECLKSDESPSRLFLHSDCMADYMLDGSVLELTRMNQFNMLFTATCNNLDINPNLRSVGLILMLETNL